LQGGADEGRDGQQSLHQSRDGGDETGVRCRSDVMQGVHPTRDETDMGRAALVRQGFPSREQGKGGSRNPGEVMEKMQVVKKAFSRLIRPSDDQPRSMPQFPQLGMQEGGEGKTGSGAMQAGHAGAARPVS
jgi:hypothetical protein